MAEILGAWNSFYVMIGSSAAALTGLMFVVITLVSGNQRTATPEGVSTFSTPTVVHFCCVIFTAAYMTIPFRSFIPVAILMGLAGAAGSIYVVRVALRSRTLSTYRPDAEDFTCHAVLPIVAYAILIAGAIALNADTTVALYAPAAAAMLLIFVGIHNAWDVVTYITIIEAAKSD